MRLNWSSEGRGIIDFYPGQVSSMQYWFVVDHLHGFYWVYCVDGSQWLVGEM